MGAKSCLFLERQSPMLRKAKRREWGCLCFLSTRLVIISGNARVEQRQLRSTWRVLERGSKARPQLARSRVLERRFLWSWVGTLPSLCPLPLLPAPNPICHSDACWAGCDHTPHPGEVTTHVTPWVLFCTWPPHTPYFTGASVLSRHYLTHQIHCVPTREVMGIILLISKNWSQKGPRSKVFSSCLQ